MYTIEEKGASKEMHVAKKNPNCSSNTEKETSNKGILLTQDQFSHLGYSD